VNALYHNGILQPAVGFVQTKKKLQAPEMPEYFDFTT
jgi:hypothetical protein